MSTFVIAFFIHSQKIFEEKCPCDIVWKNYAYQAITKVLDNILMRRTYLYEKHLFGDYRLDYITVFYIRRQKEMDHNRICHYTNYSKKLQLKYFVIYVHICHRLFHLDLKICSRKNVHVILFDKIMHTETVWATRQLLFW